MEYLIKQYALEQGALEIQYIEEFFGEFPRRKTAAEIVRRLGGRAHIILMAEAPLPDDPGLIVPVSYKVAHELLPQETEPKLADLVARLWDCIAFDGRRLQASAAEGATATVHGAALNHIWRPIPVRAELRFGGATIAVTCEEVPAGEVAQPPKAGPSNAPPSPTTLIVPPEARPGTSAARASKSSHKARKPSIGRMPER